MLKTSRADGSLEAFELALLRLTYVPFHPTTLYGDNGIELRGALGQALLETVCYEKETCRKEPCAFAESCVFAYIFKGNATAYAVQLPAWQRFQACSADEPLTFTLALFGDALTHWRLLAKALQRLPNYLFDTHNSPVVPSRLAGAISLGTPDRTSNVCLEADKGLESQTLLRLRAADILNEPHPELIPRLELTFETPTNLAEKRAGKKERIQEPTFSQIMKFVILRIRQAAGLPRDVVLDLDLSAATEVTCLRHDLKQVTVKRFSKNQKFEIWMHGFQGGMAFADVPGKYLPYLRLASCLGLGVKTTHGLGHFLIRNY